MKKILNLALILKILEEICLIIILVRTGGEILTFDYIDPKIPIIIEVIGIVICIISYFLILTGMNKSKSKSKEIIGIAIMTIFSIGYLYNYLSIMFGYLNAILILITLPLLLPYFFLPFFVFLISPPNFNSFVGCLAVILFACSNILMFIATKMSINKKNKINPKLNNNCNLNEKN